MATILLCIFGSLRRRTPIRAQAFASFQLRKTTGCLTQIEKGIGEDVDFGAATDRGLESGEQPGAFHGRGDHPGADNDVSTPIGSKSIQEEGIMLCDIPHIWI